MLFLSGISNIAQQERVLATKGDDLSSIPGHGGRREPTTASCPPTFTYML